MTKKKLRKLGRAYVWYNPKNNHLFVLDLVHTAHLVSGKAHPSFWYLEFVGEL